MIAVWNKHAIWFFILLIFPDLKYSRHGSSRAEGSQALMWATEVQVLPVDQEKLELLSRSQILFKVPLYPLHPPWLIFFPLPLYVKELKNENCNGLICSPDSSLMCTVHSATVQSRSGLGTFWTVAHAFKLRHQSGACKPNYNYRFLIINLYMTSHLQKLNAK